MLEAVLGSEFRFLVWVRGNSIGPKPGLGLMMEVDYYLNLCFCGIYATFDRRGKKSLVCPTFKAQVCGRLMSQSCDAAV